MADVFFTEDYEDSPDENNDNESPAETVIIGDDSETDPLKLTDDSSENSSEKNSRLNDDSSDMTLKESAEESELNASEDQLVNPDDLLPPVVKLEKYANSEIVFNRQVVARNLLETLRLVQENEEDVQRVLQVICSISEDFDPSVRTELMVQFPHIIAFFNEAELHSIIKEYLVPILNKFLGDDINNVRKACQSALLTIMEQGFVDAFTISDRVCPHVLAFTFLLHPEELRCETIMVISKMIVLMGKHFAEKLFFERFFILCYDKTNNIRKACASAFGDICTTVGQEITENILLPKFFTLCEDSAWCVRKACAENFMPVSCVVSRETRRNELSSLYMILLNDQSRWVRLTAFQALGPFISTFAEPDRTGLYYSKDGVLTVINVPAYEEKKQNNDTSPVCNGLTDELCIEDNSRTISCDGVSSLCNIDSTLSTASDIPGISCQVGSNYCTVIEVTSSSDVKCDLNTGDNWSAMDASNSQTVEKNSTESFTVDSDDYPLEERMARKLWDEALYGSSESCVIDENVKSQLDTGKGDEKSTFLTAITVNGVKLGLSAALSELTNCDSTPFVIDSSDSSCELKTNGPDETVPETAADSIVEMDDVSELKTASSESAFNHFQYWRDPLPDVEIDAEACDSTFPVLCFNSRPAVQKLSYAQILRRKLDSKLGIKREEELSENKGEPPPGTLSPHDQDIVPPELLLQYLSMIDADWAQTIDAEIARHCAYSLPAVALTLGRQFWPCLKETFDALSSDLQGCIMMWKVRRTVASAMHQLAVILGPDITSKDLLPVFSRFINDLDEVRVGILQHLYDFLQVLHTEERNQFLPSLPQFLISNSDSDSNDKNWRFRLILAEQLVSIADLYEPLQVRKHLVPLSLTLIKDKICEVRLAAVRVMASVMKQFKETPVHSKAFLSILTENFVHSPKWLYRQLYVYICQQIILEKSLTPDQFAEDALPQLLYLCWDRVPNVRIAIARCLVVVIWPIEVFSNPESPHRELLLQTIHTLQSDTDSDVRFYANMVSTHECSCLQNGEFPNAAEPYL